jgi:WhiB family redox-sensing transcriptional regulator
MARRRGRRNRRRLAEAEQQMTATTATATVSPGPTSTASGRIESAADLRERAPCGDDPDLFFSILPDEVTMAKAICARCSMTSRCLSYSLDMREEYGTWGGVGEEERRWLLRRAHLAEGPRG